MKKKKKHHRQKHHNITLWTKQLTYTLIKLKYEQFESNTVGGWVTEQFGIIPPIGETFRFEDLEIRIVKATKQKVLKVRTRRVNEEEKDEKEDK